MRMILSRAALAAVAWALTMPGGRAAANDEPEFDPKAHPPPGKLVDVGGWRLHLDCAGSGGPAVVFASGSGDFSFDWALVQPGIARFARACAYDRAGDAWSDPGPIPRTMRQEAYELHTLLERAGIAPPYVLVGHSYGGLLVRVYAERYPDEVAGMVLVDATHEDTVLMMNGKLVRMRELDTGKPVPDVKKRMTEPPRLPTPKELQEFRDFRKFIKADRIDPPFDRLTEPIQRLRLWARSRPPVPAGEGFWAEELAAMHAGREAKPQPLGDKPLAVIIPGRRDGPPPGVTAEEWAKLVEEKVRQKEGLAGLSRNSRIVRAPQSGHHIQLDEPAVVVSAIREVVEAARTGGRLHRAAVGKRSAGDGPQSAAPAGTTAIEEPGSRRP
jgi:pimeloyl-ACP methyl ester carboxylesterase